ncbi:MAG: 3-dehydroquinate synthase [Anaerolineae bacterium]
MSHSRNVVITGFMGTGKSTVGRRVARWLGRSFVDMDSVIEERAGKPIPAIFASEGEARFREMEADLCRELGQRSGLVIATGGGALVDPANRVALADGALAVCLGCREDVLVERLGGSESRPMLAGDDTRRRIRDLLRKRGPAYQRIPFHIETATKTPDEVAKAIVALVESEASAQWVHGEGFSYPVLVGTGLRHHLGALVAARGFGPRMAVVSNETIAPLYLPELMRSLQASGFAPFEACLPDGETHKTLEAAAHLYDAFVEQGLDRSGAVVAVGGGVLTDTAGFAAATYMRGVPIVMIPTSLLGMVDASVGGKVAVDRPQGKNLVGAFHQPAFVVVDMETLATLPELQRRAGLAETIKAGIIGDPELFAAFEADAELDLGWAVERAIAVKIAVVEQDPEEHGVRATLNLGHTFGHAFERLADYQLAHGLAISMGMVAAAHLGEIVGLCSADTRSRIQRTLAKHDLPIVYKEQRPERVLEAMRSDKKRRGGRLRLIVPRSIGEVTVEGNVSDAEILEALERTRQ